MYEKFLEFDYYNSVEDMKIKIIFQILYIICFCNISINFKRTSK